MRVYDVTFPLDESCPVWEGEPKPALEWRNRLENGHYCNLSSFAMGSHTGTHIDAPAHFVAGGGTIESIAVERLVGPALVVEFHGSGDITAADLGRMGVGGAPPRVLFKTANARLWDDPAFHRDFVALSLDAVERLIELGLQLVGIDYLSVEAFDSARYEVHHRLLDAGIVALEGVDLRQVPPGEYLLVCAPLKLTGAEGAPARVFLIAGL